MSQNKNKIGTGFETLLALSGFAKLRFEEISCVDGFKIIRV
jgi:hypothetical protein